jgi:CDP-glycerol glycerophosphotransferase (TagB/SpsB family)
MDLINYNYNVTIKDLGMGPNNKTILYTPTLGWKTCTCQSSFFDYINKLVYWSLEYNFNLIVRPHPYFLKQFPEAQNLLDNMGKLDNVKVDFTYNYYLLFKLVDFIISDISSLAYEFLITTKPVVLTRTSFKKEELFQDYVDNNIMYEVKNSNELENRIRLLLNNEDEFKNRRITFVNDLPKNSSKLIKEYIKENYR